jgi:hypothetical protein
VEVPESLRTALAGGPPRLHFVQDALAEKVAGTSQRVRGVGMKALEMCR